MTNKLIRRALIVAAICALAGASSGSPEDAMEESPVDLNQVQNDVATSRLSSKLPVNRNSWLAIPEFEQDLEKARALSRELEDLRNVLTGPIRRRRGRAAEVDEATERWRRNLSQNSRYSQISNAMERLAGIESMLDNGSDSRLGRVYKPRTISTARGFGKRSGRQSFD